MIIGEIGINHEGSELTAREMLKNLMETSIDAITFQIPTKEYLNCTEPKRIPLSKEFYEEAIIETHRNNKKIGFACGDSTLINFLDNAGSNFWKTFSWDINNKDLHRELQKTLKKTYVSTGVSGIQEIIKIDGTLKNISFIHTQISNEITDVNLKAINTMKSKINNTIPLGKFGETQDIINITDYLIEKNNYMTGNNININGGLI